MSNQDIKEFKESLVNYYKLLGEEVNKTVKQIESIPEDISYEDLETQTMAIALRFNSAIQRITKEVENDNKGI